MTSVCRMMPASMRKNAVSKDNAPNPAKLRRDLHDEFGETPYKTEEVVPGKVGIILSMFSNFLHVYTQVWWVTYTYQDDTLTDPKAREEAKKWGIDPTTEQYKQVQYNTVQYSTVQISICRPCSPGRSPTDRSTQTPAKRTSSASATGG